MNMKPDKLERIIEIIKSCKTMDQIESCVAFEYLPFVHPTDVSAREMISITIVNQISLICNTK